MSRVESAVRGEAGRVLAQWDGGGRATGVPLTTPHGAQGLVQVPPSCTLRLLANHFPSSQGGGFVKIQMLCTSMWQGYCP